MARPSVPPVESLRPSGPLTFLQPGEPESTPSPSDLPSTEQLADPSPSNPLPSEPDDASAAPAGPTSSRGSSGSVAVGKRTIQRQSRKAVKMAGVGAHRMLARDEAARQVGMYLTDEEDDEGIGDPLGSIVHRHGWLGDAANPDVVDGINAVIALGAYAWKQIQRGWAARQLRAQQRAAEAAGTEQSDDERPTAPVELDTPAWVGR